MCRFRGVYIFCHLIFPLKPMGSSILSTLPAREAGILIVKRPWGTRVGVGGSPRGGSPGGAATERSERAVLFGNGKTRALVSCTEASRGMLEGPGSAVRGSVPKFLGRGIIGVSEERWPSCPCFQGGESDKEEAETAKKWKKFQTADNQCVFQYWERIWHVPYRFRRKMLGFRRSCFQCKLLLALQIFNRGLGDGEMHRSCLL